MRIGQPVARLDGPAKVTGTARYAGDQHADGELHAAFVGATIAAGAVEQVDPAEAAREPGVARVLTAVDMPAIHPGFAAVASPPLATRFVPMQGEDVFYAGQPVAMVLADSLEAAEAGAELVRVTYRPAPFIVPGQRLRGHRPGDLP
jgi:xanthine dehydrogenase YagR molybdenum-binding subunit